MSIRDYDYELRTSKSVLNAAICVYQKPGISGRSPINKMLETIINGLKKELPDYTTIQTAYVYETRGLQSCIPFEPLTTSSEPYYMEAVRDAADHSLDHVFFMGMALLEQAKGINRGECRLYLVTDDRFEHVNDICRKDEGEIVLNPRFKDVNPRIIIYKSEKSGGEEIERAVRKQFGGQVITI